MVLFADFLFFFHQSDNVSLARPNAFAKMADPVCDLQMTPNSTQLNDTKLN